MTLLPAALLCAATPALAQASGDDAAVTLSLADALDAAASNNLTLEALETTIAQADGRFQQSLALLLPMLSAGGSWTHADHDDTVDFGAGMSDLFDSFGIPMPEDYESTPTVVRVQDEVSGTLTASVGVLDPHAWATVHLADEGRELAQRSVEQARQQLLFGVAQAWYAVHMTGALVEVQQNRAQTSLEHLDVAQQRFAAGTGLRLDVVRASADLTQARQDLLSSRLAWESSRDALGVLTGVGGLPVAGEAPALTVPGDDAGLLVDRALDRREDIRVARQDVELSRAALAAVRTEFLPSVGLAWQGSYRFTDASGLSSDDPSRWTMVANLSVPVYAHNRIGELKEKRAALRQAELKLEDTERQAGQAVRQAIRDQETAAAAQDLALERAELAREALMLSETAFAQGAGSSLEVSDAQAGQVAAEVNRLTSELQAQVDTLALLRALGADMLSVVR